MLVLERLLAVLIILLIGTGLRVTGVLSDTRAAQLNTVTYYVALPALIFGATYQQSVVTLLSPKLVGGLVVILATMLVLAWLVHRNLGSKRRQSVALVQSYHSNLGYLGLPLVAATFDTKVTASASVILGVFSVIQVPLTIVLLTSINDSSVRLTRELRQLATNPVLISLLAGIAVGLIDSGIPSTIATGINILGSFALPLALLCVGASLRIDLSAIDLSATGAVVVLKNGCMPVLTWTVFSLLGVNPSTFIASVVMLGTPTAVSTFVYANELGGDERFASVNVFVTTLISTGTLFILIRLVV